MSTALITGASRGFGHALAQALVTDGWTVLGDGRDRIALERAAARLGRHQRFTPVAGDVTDPSHRADLAVRAGALDALDLVVLNASALGPSPLPRLAEHPLDALERVYATNVLAPVALLQGLLPALRRSTRPTVVTLSSDAAVETYPGWGGYGSSKAALDHVAAVLAVEEPWLRIYAFDPGDMRTGMHQAAFPDEDIADRPDPATVVPALRRLLADRPTSGRYGRTDLLTGRSA